MAQWMYMVSGVEVPTVDVDIEVESEDAVLGKRRRQRLKGVVGGSRAPAEMSRRGQALRARGRCGRMREFRLSAVIVEGEETVTGRSGIGGEKRTTSESGVIFAGRWGS